MLGAFFIGTACHSGDNIILEVCSICDELSTYFPILGMEMSCLEGR